MLEITQKASTKLTVTWDKSDDPRGWIAQAVTLDHLGNALRALGDPMTAAHVAADDPQARDELRSVSWLLEQLSRRRDALIVALKDRRFEDPANQAGASWADLARLLDPDEGEPQAKRSKVQAMYNAGRRRTGLPAK